MSIIYRRNKSNLIFSETRELKNYGFAMEYYVGITIRFQAKLYHLRNVHRIEWKNKSIK